jgi:hypothetical protein
MRADAVIQTVKACAGPPTHAPIRAHGLVPPNSLERAYTGIGLAAGFAGLILPPAMVLGWLVWDSSVETSLSKYYHTGMRDVFVGILFIAGFSLIFYRLWQWGLHNLFSVGAGVGALMLAIFPTRIDASRDDGTPLQQAIGHDASFNLHIAGTVLFFACIAIICLGFAFQERDRPEPKDRAGRPPSHTPQFWFRFHLAAVIVIVCSCLFMLVAGLINEDNVDNGVIIEHATLFGESLAIFAFGASWTAIGSEFRKLITFVPPTAVNTKNVPPV